MSGLDVVWSVWGHAVLGGSVVLAVGAGVLLAIRAPAQRVQLVNLTTLACLSVPALGMLPGLPRWSVTGGSPPPVVVEVARARSAGPDRATVVSLPTAAEPEALPSRASLGRGPVGASTRVTIDPPRPLDLRAVVVGAWLVGVVGLLAWWSLGLVALIRVVRQARPAPAALVERFQGLVGPAGRATRLLVADRLALPITFTCGRPVILLPDDWDGADAPERDLALLHEWSHVERHDFLGWTLSSLAATLWWFCPLGWWLRRELRLGQDLLADDRAARLGSALDLAALLVRLARVGRGPAGTLVPLPALGIRARRCHLSRRVAMLVADHPPLATRCRPVWTGSAVVLLALLALLASALRLDAAPQEPAKSPPNEVSRAEAPPAEAPRAGHEWTGTIIDEATGQPIAGAQVRVNLQLSQDPKTGGWSQIRDIESVTPADGSYRFTLSDAEQNERSLYVTLFVQHPDHVRYFGGYSFSMILKNNGLGERPFFERLKLPPALAVSGQVLTPDGAPASGVKVNAYSTPAVNDSGIGEGKWSDTRTDAAGRFRLPLHPTGQAVLWLLPAELEPVTVPLRANRRGDLGTFRLNAGIRIRGKVVDEAGQPVGGVYVQAGRINNRPGKDSGIPNGVGDNIQRTVLTSADGAFTVTPLPPGPVMVRLSEQSFDPANRDNAVDLPSRPLPAVFLPQTLTLEGGSEPESLTFRAVPSVTVRAQITDSKGVKKGGSGTFLSGNIGGQWWSNSFEPTRDGTYTMRAPRGLERAGFGLITNEHSAMAWRLTRDASLQRTQHVDLGTLDRDMDGIEIVRYAAPVIVVRVVDAAGQPVPRPKVTVNYTESRQPNQGGRFVLGPDHYSDVSLEGPQEDGRVRTSQLQPNREVEVTAEAPGFGPARRTLTLPEGKTEELTLTLPPK